MISKAVQEAFMARDLDNHDWLKDVPASDFDAILADKYGDFTFNDPPLWHHQKAAFILGASYPEFLYFLDMGLGKSRIILDQIRYRKHCGNLRAALVLVPNITNVFTWSVEAKKLAPDLTLQMLHGSSADKAEQVNIPADVYCTTYAGLTAMLSFPTEVKRKKGLVTEWVIDWELAHQFASLFNFLVLDESTEVKSHRSLQYELCKGIAKVCDYKYALTGTPFNRDLQELWPQFQLIDGGETLGRTLGIFRACFFREKKNYWGGYEYTFQKRQTKKLHEVIKHRSIAYDSDECVDLPPKREKLVKINFYGGAEPYYEAQRQKIIAAGKNVKLMENAFLRLRQISSGFLSYKDEDTGERIEIEFPENPKLDACMDRVSKLPINRKCIIVHEFIKSGDMISRALTKAKIKHCKIAGATKDKMGELQRFLDDPEYTVLVLNHMSGGKGTNIQVANYVIWYESPVSVINRLQTMKRAWRPGQTRKVMFYDLVVTGTVDEKILKYVKEGKDVMRAVISGEEPIQGVLI
jgi:SNF2 family DNA or RNA helicase